MLHTKNPCQILEKYASAWFRVNSWEGHLRQSAPQEKLPRRSPLLQDKEEESGLEEEAKGLVVALVAYQ